jgi:NAD(P)-dependent dehydrogenase (short-subunit alcohol dehydrogenase family)
VFSLCSITREARIEEIDDMTRFRGKVALVTGASSGIGRATAIAFGKQGATVVVTGRREKEGRETLDMLRAVGGDGAFIRLDVSVEGEVMGVIRDIMSRYGRLDSAANCAGNDIVNPLTEYSESDYDAIFNTNVKGLLFCLKHEISAMRDNGGAIVNIGSIAAQLSDLGNSLYNAGKSAAHSLTRTAAAEAAKYRTRVNEVAPGPTATPLLEDFCAPPRPRAPLSVPRPSPRTYRSAGLVPPTKSPTR